MPTYQYRCTECGHELEAVQKFSDPSLTVCPSCEGKLNKVFSAVGIVFKGSGFYATDSRRKSSAATPAAASETKTDASSPAAQPKESAPAASKPAEKSSPSVTSTAA